ncbi:MAG: HlyC/CorC family transporter [Eubacterium sp.]|nr:HlyC/CorC family transporter [Eubacterium sp.]
MDSDSSQLFLIAAIAIIIIAVVLVIVYFKFFKKKSSLEEAAIFEEDVKSILEEGQKTGVINEEGRKRIESLFRFDDELAYEIMTPRTDVFMIDINDPPEEYMDQLMELRYSRIPVCEDDPDHIIGILNLKDFFASARQYGFDGVELRPILREAYFIPETKKIDTLFVEMQRKKQHIAVLIDEYGGFSGIVTMEDIIEEIVGEIDDEYDEEEEIIDKIADDTYLVDGNVSLDDLNETTGSDLESENSETIGGFILDLVGEIPKDGYVNRTVKDGRYEFTILSVKERRIERVRFRLLPEETNGDDEN